jgi:multicomponent Na+:H+ antiporter subunit D
MGTIGATFYVIGIGLLYMMTGTLNMADLAQRLPQVAETRTILVALAFLTVGMSLKLALFPLHLWLPNAYCYAPSMVTAFLAATATKVGVYVLLRIFFSVFGAAYVFEAMPVGKILLTLAILAMFAASTVAIFQNNVKRMLAYSSVAQIGYIVLGISFASVTGLTGGIVHLFNHAVTKGALFLVLGCVFLRLGSVRLDDMAGLGRAMPLTMAAFVVGGLSLIGLPLTAGFISKWYLILAALEAGWWPVAALVVLSSLLAVVYVWRVVEVVYFRPAPGGGAQAVREAPLDMLIPAWILIAAIVYFGLDTSFSVGVAGRAAALLLGAGP